MVSRGTLARVAGISCAGVVAIGTLGACGSDDGTGGSGASAKKPVRVGLFIAVSASTHQQAMIKGAEAAATRLGGVKIRTFDAASDANKQVQQVQAAAASGQYDALVLAPIDGARLVPAIKQAAAKDIKVVCTFSVCGPDQAKFAKQLPELVAQTGVNAGVLGEQAAPIVNKACAGKDPCKLAIMHGLAQLVSEKWWADKLKVGLDPNVKIVATGQGLFAPDASYKAFKDILQAHRDIDVVASPGDQMIVGSEQAIDEAGLKGKVKLIGTGAGVIGTKAVKDGRWFATAAFRPYHDGYVGMKYAVDATRGQKVAPLTNTQISPLIPGGFVTAENVAEWKPEWAG